jgi:hypothetical protein
MARSLAALASLAALLASGCVPVFEPLGSLDKAEPDKALIGTWTVTGRTGLSALLQTGEITIDAPAVKGNPKGLMRATGTDFASDLWFFAVASDKHTYANAIVADEDRPGAQLAKEGQFAEWQKQERKGFFVFRYTVDGDTLTIDSGNLEGFAKLMKNAGVKDDGAKYVPFFYTPAKWADTHFAKGAGDKVYDKSNTLTLKRKKD